MNRVQQKFIMDALSNERLLSPAESRFINKLADQKTSYELSKAENEKLNRIQRKIG